MDALELKDTIHFLRDFGDIHHGISSHSSPAPLKWGKFHHLTNVWHKKKVRGPGPILK